MEDLLKKSDQEILEIAHQLREAYKLKRTLRYDTARDFSVHSESVAEHVFALILLARFFLKVEPACASLDPEKVYRILFFHDFPEIKYGDAVTYHKTKEHEEREKEAAKEIFASLPMPLAQEGLQSWQEYEEHTSPEARFAYALDKTEPLFEIFDPVNERSMKRLKVTFDMHVSNKYPVAKDYPVLMRFIKVLSEDMNRRGVFWEK